MRVTRKPDMFNHPSRSRARYMRIIRRLIESADHENEPNRRNNRISKESSYDKIKCIDDAELTKSCTYEDMNAKSDRKTKTVVYTFQITRIADADSSTVMDCGVKAIANIYCDCINTAFADIGMGIQPDDIHLAKIQVFDPYLDGTQTYPANDGNGDDE